jgi:hypothetical protein
MIGSDDGSIRLNISIHRTKHPKAFDAIRYYKEKKAVISDKYNEGLEKLYEEDRKGEKLESFPIFDDDHQSELHTFKFPPMDDPEAFRDPEFHKRFRNELTPKEQGRAIRRCYINFEIVKHMERAVLEANEIPYTTKVRIETEEEEKRRKSMEEHHRKYHLDEINTFQRKSNPNWLELQINVCAKYKDICPDCEELYTILEREKQYKESQEAKLKAEWG